MEEELELSVDSLKNKYIILTIDDDKYAIEIRYVHEIIGLLPITQIPDQPYYVKGVINLRGRIIPVMDCRLRLHKDEYQYDEMSSMVVINDGSKVIALMVDRVDEVLEIDDSLISAPPDVSENSTNKYIKGVGLINNQLYLVFDCHALIVG